MFLSSLDAMLLAYKLRADLEWSEVVNVQLVQERSSRAEVERLIAEQNAFLEMMQVAELDARIAFPEEPMLSLEPPLSLEPALSLEPPRPPLAGE
jgi:hypothetical protein